MALAAVVVPLTSTLVWGAAASQQLSGSSPALLLLSSLWQYFFFFLSPLIFVVKSVLRKALSCKLHLQCIQCLCAKQLIASVWAAL